MSFWVPSGKDDRKRRLFWGKIKLEPTVVWMILGSEVLGHDSAGVISCVLSELPATHKQLLGKRGIPMLSICHMDHSHLLTLIINSKLTSLDSLCRCKLRPQCWHFEGMLSRIKAVNPHVQGMSKTHTQPVLVWNISMPCSTGFNCIMRGLIQLLIWLLPKPRNWVTDDWLLPFLYLHPCPYISQPKSSALRS